MISGQHFHPADAHVCKDYRERVGSSRWRRGREAAKPGGRGEMQSQRQTDGRVVGPATSSECSLFLVATSSRLSPHRVVATCLYKPGKAPTRQLKKIFSLATLPNEALWTSCRVCFVSSLVVSCLLTFSMLMRSLVRHRINLQHLYRGAVVDVFHRPRKLQPSQQALVCWMCFTGFQAAFTSLGLLIQQVVFFVCAVAFTFLVVIPLQTGTNMYLFKIAESMWPFWLTLVVSVLAQNLLAHFCFLEKGRPPRELTNRRALYILTYLLFPVNVLVGVLAGVWRMVVSALYNVVHFCQLDVSLLSHGTEAFDPGYRTYCYFLNIEVSQSHPAVKAFCWLLLQSQSPPGPKELQPTDIEEGVMLMKQPASKASRRKQNCARWCLAYTLLHNPSLLPYRKGALSDAAANRMQTGPGKP